MRNIILSEEGVLDHAEGGGRMAQKCIERQQPLGGMFCQRTRIVSQTSVMMRGGTLVKLGDRSA